MKAAKTLITLANILAVLTLIPYCAFAGFVSSVTYAGIKASVPLWLAAAVYPLAVLATIVYSRRWRRERLVLAIWTAWAPVLAATAAVAIPMLLIGRS